MTAFYLTSLGIVPLFVSRAFLPLFASAAIARFGPGWSWAADAAGVELLADLPAWSTSDAALLILAVMAALEGLMARVPELRQAMIYSDTQLKGIAAFLVCFFLVEGDPRDLLGHLRQEGLSTDYAWGQSFAYTWSFAIGWTVWFGARMRRGVYAVLGDADADDSLGLHKLLAWGEDAVGFFGVFFAVFLPLVACALAALTLASLFVLRRMLEARERRSRAGCPACGSENHLCALECASCRRALPAPRRAGLLGTARADAVGDVDLHRLRLIANKRCRSCAERLVERRADQSCPACGTAVFEDAEAFEAYLASVRARLPRTLGIVGALGLVPVLGLVPGIVYYRVGLIAGLRHYVPRSLAMLSRTGVRILSVVLLCLQPVPVLGALTLPLMCGANYAVYGAALRRQAPGRGSRAVSSRLDNT